MVSRALVDVPRCPGVIPDPCVCRTVPMRVVTSHRGQPYRGKAGNSYGSGVVPVSAGGPDPAVTSAGVASRSADSGRVRDAFARWLRPATPIPTDGTPFGGTRHMEVPDMERSQNSPAQPRSRGRRVADGSTAEVAPRDGLCARGAIHVLVGIPAVRIDLGSDSGREADRSGAVGILGEQPFGRALLWRWRWRCNDCVRRRSGRRWRAGRSTPGVRVLRGWRCSTP
ncbi:DUF1206 domain-containing protein [Streptomyces sp. NPDC086147]|uniref:DUF1206 domain-containing protein n=1 Tax=Streptomyces sp. NPDC086147 TaxID=3155295 RepID=UPI003450351A